MHVSGDNFPIIVCLVFVEFNEFLRSKFALLVTSLRYLGRHCGVGRRFCARWRWHCEGLLCYEHVAFIFMKITSLYLQPLNLSPKQQKPMFPQEQTELCTISTKRYISLYGHLLNLNQFNPNMAGVFEGIVFCRGGSPFHPFISRRTNLILIILYTTVKYPIYNRYKIRPIIVNFSFIVISCT